jgi:hypothetical protein
MNPDQPFAPLQPHSYERLESRRARRRKTVFIVVVIVTAAVLLVGSIVAAVVMTGDSGPAGQDTAAASTSDDDTAKQTAPPTTGAHHIKVSGTELCLTAGPEPGNEERTVTVLADCAQVKTTVELDIVESGAYLIRMPFPEEDWTACLAVDPPAAEEGFLLGPYDCAEAEFGEFTLLPHPEGGFNITVDGTADMCLDSLESHAEAGIAIAIMPCDAEGPSQRFEFLPA